MKIDKLYELTREQILDHIDVLDALEEAEDDARKKQPRQRQPRK